MGKQEYIASSLSSSASCRLYDDNSRIKQNHKSPIDENNYSKDKVSEDFYYQQGDLRWLVDDELITHQISEEASTAIVLLIIGFFFLVVWIANYVMVC